MLEYECTGCGRTIRTSDDMYGKVEPCPYCEKRNVAGAPAHNEPDAEDLFRSAKSSLVLAVLSFFWGPLLFLTPLLLPFPVIFAVVSQLLARKVKREMPEDSELCRPGRDLARTGWKYAIMSLTALTIVAIFLAALAYKPWAYRGEPKPVPGPEGPPENTSLPQTLPAANGMDLSSQSGGSYPRPATIPRNGPSRETRPCAVRRPRA